MDADDRPKTFRSIRLIPLRCHSMMRVAVLHGSAICILFMSHVVVFFLPLNETIASRVVIDILVRLVGEQPGKLLMPAINNSKMAQDRPCMSMER